MTPDEDHILELSELCNDLTEGTISKKDFARLEQLLAASAEARRFYARYFDQSASLQSYASEMQSENATPAETRRSPRFFRNWQWWGTVAAAAAMAAVLTLMFIRRPSGGEAAAPGESVARLTGLNNAAWETPSAGLELGVALRSGQRLQLVNGLAEVTFDSGAKLVLEGPATLDIASVWEASLLSGTLRATVPPEAIGFRITNSDVEVLDLGTEFSMIANPAGGTEVLVLKGEVEALSRYVPDRDSLLLREKESRLFSQGGIYEISDHDLKFARFQSELSLERQTLPVQLVKWSFDSDSWDAMATDPGQSEGGRSMLLVQDGTGSPLADATVPGHRGRGLGFDGEVIARAAYPGISSDASRTISFWVKVPENAPLSSAYSMVAWRADGPGLGSRPVHIGWNRNPDEGPIGALRTDFSGGHAIGTTQLRDGRWHHVAVVFVPSNSAGIPTEVKHYVDGRLESNTITPGQRRSMEFRASANLAPELKDVLWLGCRLGTTGPRRDHFVGDLDELTIADRPLDPHEIQQLMLDPKALYGGL